MKLGVLLNDPEEEHDCFSDNTQYSHYYDGIGIQNIYQGSYTRLDGTTVSGPSLKELLNETDPAIADQLQTDIAASVTSLKDIVTATENGMAYDMMLARGNATGEALILGAVDTLVAQTRSIERAVTALKLNAIELEGSDSLDAPDAVFQ
jgi:putative iron-regulated protein